VLPSGGKMVTRGALAGPAAGLLHDCSRRAGGGQPLTSGPARVRLTRTMTRRSRSIAAR
jgi:hypothetical protein